MNCKDFIQLKNFPICRVGFTWASKDIITVLQVFKTE